MKSVSNAYKSSMEQILRNRSFVKVTFQNIDTSATSDGEWVDNGHESFSELDTLDYERIYGRTFATLELNRWSLDGSLDIYNGQTVTDGFVSSYMSGADGSYATPPTLTREFSAIHQIVGLTLSFDTRTDEWPVKIAFEFYLQGTIIDTLIAEHLTGSSSILLHPIEQYDKIVIRPITMLPYRRFRVEGVIYGVSRQYGNNEIVSTFQSHDVDPLSRRLPAETFSFTILDFDHNYDPDNPQGIYTYVEEKSPISITFGYELDNGTVEWIKPDRYLLNAKPSVQNERVRFEATGLIGSLTDTYYKSMTGNKNLYNMAQAVLMDANLGLTASGDHPWVIDESLREMWTTAVLPIDTHMNCLQLIAHAGRCRLFTDDDNIVHVESFPMNMWERTNDFLLDFTTITEKRQVVTKIDKLKSVSVAQYSYLVADEAITLYHEQTQEEILHVEFAQPAQDVTISVEGGELISSEIYGRAVDMVLTAGLKTITISGVPLTESTVVINTPVNASGEVDVEENPLITNEAMRIALTEHVIQYLTMRSTYDVDYRGNPEVEVGDIIGMQTRYTDDLPVLVLADEISFSGGLRGNIKAKGLI